MMEFFKSDLFKGVLIGVGVSAVGFYAYKKNETKVDAFMTSHGINVPSRSGKDLYSMSVEELMEAKENIEDIIAEKEMTGCQETTIEA